MSNYNIDNIQHLNTREAMRTKIPMYLGSDTTEGIYQALKEIINNSTDEALVGYGKEVDILLNEETNEITVRDYGQGFLVNEIRDDGKTILEAAFSVLNTSGKYREDRNI